MSESAAQWSPLAIRLIVGAGLIASGWGTLSGQAEHAEIAGLLTALGLPWADGLASALGWIQLAGGLALVIGLWARAAALASVVALAVLLVAGAPSPGVELGLFTIAALLAVAIGGAGALSVDRQRALRRALRVKGFTLIARVTPGEEEALTSVLSQVEADKDDNPYVRFSEDRLSHFARFVLLPAESDPAGLTRLLYSAVHNGDFESYIEEIVRVSPGLDEIWGRCEGYRGRDEFLEFARDHFSKVREPFYAFPYETVQSIRAKIAIRQSVERFLQLDDVATYLQRPGVEPFLDLLAALAPGPTLVERIRRRARRIAAAAFEWIRQRILSVLLFVAQQYAYLGTRRTYSPVPPEYGPPEDRLEQIRHQNELETFDERNRQNQLTLFVSITPRYLWRLLLAQFSATFLNRYGYPPGEIGGIFTIHAFHWAVIDRGRHGIFMSNYDDSMINYIGDFVDKLVWSLDVFFNNTPGYPPGGMRQVERFTRWLFRHQLLAQVFYSAYSQETVLNILRDRKIGDTLGRMYDQDKVESWLLEL